MHFAKVRLSGFKSFVEPAELVIEIGMTGVVGPNGCGKSNVVEALRWVMGETSAKSMRGGEMDDVIFGGTSSRPSRNVAEVVLTLDNSDRSAPPAFNDSEELEVSRRIERGSGSTYRVNGREVRARDVQLLFADIASGAHSTAMVNQGRVGSLIGARPAERRLLLEEAAGITGLHSRRHEAELRLRAAETNLERLDDVIGALQGQHQGLKRQARQASRYRNLSGEIRRQEAMLLHLRWQEATAAHAAATERLAGAGAAVAARTTAGAAAAGEQADAAAAMPELREAAAAAAAEMQRLLLARGELDREEARLHDAQAQIERRLAQIDADVARAGAIGTDAVAALERLEVESARLGEEQAHEIVAREDAVAAAEEARRKLEFEESALSELTETLSKVEARLAALRQQRDRLSLRIARLNDRAASVESERAALAGRAEDDRALGLATEAVAAATAALEAARTESEAAAEGLADCQDAETRALAIVRDAQAVRARLAGEQKALRAVVAPAESDLFQPLIEWISVEPGFEAALGAALGEDLEAPIDSAAPMHWRVLDPLPDCPPLPDGIRALATVVKAPPALARRLAQVGLLPEGGDGGELQLQLAAGQRLVARDGALWRWDGYVAASGAPTAAAIRLGQRNRLEEIDRELEAAEATLADRAAEGDAAQAARALAADRDRAARRARDAAAETLAGAREAHGRAEREMGAAQSRLAGLSQAAESAASDLQEAEQERNAAERALAEVADPARDRQRVDALRAAVAELRVQYVERRSALDRLTREAEERTRRLEVVQRDLTSWRARATEAAAHAGELAQRRAAAETERQALDARPAGIAAQRTRLLDAIAQAESKRTLAADALSAGEARLSAGNRALRTAEAALAEAREHRIRAEGQLEQAKAGLDAVAERIAERLECPPDDVLAKAELRDGQAIPPAEDVARKLDRLERERSGMGPVNLRAETEADELETQIATMQSEREDLIAAIARLRQAIAALNREGRQRLLEAFDVVNGHFQELFVKLFGGGAAHLALTDPEDPLNAGLEIMASPPGKKLQILSLLSGGEQALTAISLLFAVFLTNPAPLCVLDEVDAPLDDANVERFCDLLSHIAHNGDTRFLVVTHHRITMARMDRLFGVTMGERGVSQLVSVDLQRAAALRERAA